MINYLVILEKKLKTVIKWLYVFIPLIYSMDVLAVGLGDIKVYSYLNEPFSAEIIVNGADDLDVNNLFAELASPKDFMRTGIPRPFFLTKLKFEVLRNNGVTIIYISSIRPVKNPFLDFLLELVWPDGKIVKSYTVLLDPIVDKPVNREIPISQRKKNLKIDSSNNTSPNPVKNITSPDNLIAPQSNKIAQNTDAIFATALEDHPNVSNPIVAAAKDPKISPDHHDKIYAMESNTIDLDLDEPMEKPKKHHNQLVTPPNGLLDKVASSLQMFGQQPKRIKIDYEKLLDLKPSGADLHQDVKPLAESLAMVQINTELESLRNKNNNNENVNNTVVTTTTITNNYLELIKKYGNDLLLACFLVSTTIYLFYKMVQGNPAVVYNNKKKFAPKSYNMEQYSNQHNNVSNNGIKQDVSFSLHQHDTNPTMILDPLEMDHHELNELLNQANTCNDGAYANSAYITKNEEVELKIALAKQYLEAGDQKSARDILHNIPSTKDHKYQEQIDALLKCIG